MNVPGPGTNADRSEVGKFDSLSSRFWDAQANFDLCTS